ncbi:MULTISPECIES: RidA family protein [unclassified Roseitalea]|uniref:RidA family protein n=1 Tax=unclassified Roseitalea TaxID=2639107 RepID=UPI00273D9D2F|nr:MULTISPECIES: RidA family protein [unclassified Roseitalea]
MATRWTISSGSKFETLAGYSRAVVDGEFIFVSGTVGYDFKTGAIPDGAEAQTRQALANIAEALDQAGATLKDVVRVRVYLTRREDIVPVSRILGETFSDPRPTNTTVIVTLAEEEMRVELEVTALKR